MTYGAVCTVTSYPCGVSRRLCFGVPSPTITTDVHSVFASFSGRKTQSNYRKLHTLYPFTTS